MTLQLPPKETRTTTTYHGEKLEAIDEYFTVRSGTGQSVHLGVKTTYSNGETYRLHTTCGADSGVHRRNAYKVNAPAITCKRCLKRLDKMNN